MTKDRVTPRVPDIEHIEKVANQLLSLQEEVKKMDEEIGRHTGRIVSSPSETSSVSSITSLGEEAESVRELKDGNNLRSKTRRLLGDKKVYLEHEISDLVPVSVSEVESLDDRSSFSLGGNNDLEEIKNKSEINVLRNAYRKLLEYTKQKKDLKNSHLEDFKKDLVISFNGVDGLKSDAKILSEELAQSITVAVEKDNTIKLEDMKENQFFYYAILSEAKNNRNIQQFLDQNKDMADLSLAFKNSEECRKAINDIITYAKEKGRLHHEVFYHKKMDNKKGPSR